MTYHWYRTPDGKPACVHHKLYDQFGPWSYNNTAGYMEQHEAAMTGAHENYPFRSRIEQNARALVWC